MALVVSIALRGTTNTTVTKKSVFIAVPNIMALVASIVLRGTICMDPGQNVSIVVLNIRGQVVPIVLLGITRDESNIAGLIVYDGKACY